jgi:hypothetical protein
MGRIARSCTLQDLGRASKQILDLTLQSRLPSTYSTRPWTDIGGLMSYRPSFDDLSSLVAEQLVPQDHRRIRGAVLMATKTRSMSWGRRGPPRGLPPGRSR